MEKPWLASYPAAVPPTLDALPQSLLAVFQQQCQRQPEAPYLHSFGHGVSYAEVEEASTNLAAYWQHCGLLPGERIGLMMPNCIQYVIATMAAFKCGLVCVNINPLARARECAHVFRDAAMSGLVLWDGSAAQAMQALQHVQVAHVWVTQLGDELPGIKRRLLQFALRWLKRSVKAWRIDQAQTWRQACQQGQSMSWHPVTLEPDTLAYLQYTGGTTGLPKAAMLTHANVCANMQQCQVWVASCLPPQAIVLAALPLYHIFSLTVCLWTFTLWGGQVVLVANPRDTRGLLRLMKQYSIHVWVGVNTLFQSVLNHSAIKREHVRDVVLAIAGGMALQKQVAEAWYHLTHQWIVEGYGLSETSPVLTVNPVNQQGFSGSIGLPLPETCIAIKDTQGKTLPSDEVGEICAQGPQVVSGSLRCQ